MMRLIACVGCAVCATASADVLIAAAPGGGNNPLWITDVADRIGETGILDGHEIDEFNLNDATLSLEDLQKYDAVLTFTDSTPLDATTWGNTLADYVDGGGGVVMMTFNFGIGNVGRFHDEGYSPFENGSQTQGTPMGIGTVYEPDHPVMNGVEDFSGGTSSYHNTGAYRAGVVAIADWTDGLPFAAERNTLPGTIVGLNFFSPSTVSRADFWDAGTDGGRLMANALLHVAGGGGCAADVNGDGNLNILDFVAFQELFVDGDPAADCDGNGVFNILDFVCFQVLFQAGC